MLKNLLLFVGSFFLASLILVVSVFRVAQINYVFSQSPTPAPSNSNLVKPLGINYDLPSPGLLPDSFFWPVKAIRDKVWVSVTINPSKKADLYLLFADKRLSAAQSLFQEGKADLAISVLTKAEKYLQTSYDEEQTARAANMDMKGFLQKYILATLKHRQVMDEMLLVAPEDAKPLITKTQDSSKNLYNLARNGLLQAGATAPANPYGEN